MEKREIRFELAGMPVTYSWRESAHGGTETIWVTYQGRDVSLCEETGVGFKLAAVDEASAAQRARRALADALSVAADDLSDPDTDHTVYRDLLSIAAAVLRPLPAPWPDGFDAPMTGAELSAAATRLHGKEWGATVALSRRAGVSEDTIQRQCRAAKVDPVMARLVRMLLAAAY